MGDLACLHRCTQYLNMDCLQRPRFDVAHHEAVVVLDYGSQYTQLIGRRIREMNVLSIMLPGDASMVRLTLSMSRLSLLRMKYANIILYIILVIVLP